jgi:inner membrane protein
LQKLQGLRGDARAVLEYASGRDMPSPVGHALAGIAAGWIVRGNRLGEGMRGRREAAAFAALATLPDIDLIFGVHSGPTHGLGAALFAGVAAWLPGLWMGAGGAASRLRTFVACVAAYGSHALLDWLGTDSSAPIGIMALWPLTREYYESSLHVFMAVSRRIWQPELFWPQNILALARELLILVPIVAVIGWITRHTGRSGVAQEPEDDGQNRQRDRG